MAVPTGYQLLGAVGFSDKGTYDSSATYAENDLVHYNGNIWRCKVDNTTAVTPAEGQTWTLWLSSAGSNVLNDIVGVDTEGLIGTAGADQSTQDIVDKLAELATEAAYIDSASSTPQISDPILHQTDIATSQQNRNDKAAAASVAYEMEQEISLLSSNIAVQVGTISVEQGYTASIASCRKWGHTGNTRLTLSGASFSASSSWIKVGTASFYSNDDVTAPIYDGNNGKFYAGAWRLATNGNIYIMPKETITGFCGVNFMYYVP